MLSNFFCNILADFTRLSIVSNFNFLAHGNVLSFLPGLLSLISTTLIVFDSSSDTSVFTLVSRSCCFMSGAASTSSTTGSATSSTAGASSTGASSANSTLNPNSFPASSSTALARSTSFCSLLYSDLLSSSFAFSLSSYF